MYKQLDQKRTGRTNILIVINPNQNMMKEINSISQQSFELKRLSVYYNTESEFIIICKAYLLKE